MRRRSSARFGWAVRARVRPDAKVAENKGAGYGCKSRGSTGQGGIRFLRQQSELSAQLGNQHFLDVRQP